MSAPVATPLPYGTKVRLTRDIPKGWGYDNSYAEKAGSEFIIDDYDEGVQPGHEAWGNDEWIQGAHYQAHAVGYDGSGDVTLPADAVEVLKTAQEMADRPLPTLRAVAQHLASCALSSGDDIEFDGSSVEGDQGLFQLEGRTADGLTISVQVLVRSIYRGF